jgi:hypothetical protein
MWSRITSPTPVSGCWTTTQIRVTNIKVVFDNRASAVTGASGSVAFTATPRVAACIVPFTEAELSSDLVPKVEDFTGRPMSINGRQTTINIPVPPSVPIGTFGSNSNADTRLLIYQSGYNGKVSVIVTYQTMGWPSVGLALAEENATENPQPSGASMLGNLFQELSI